MTSGILPFLLLGLGSELWTHIEFNPASPADVAKLLDYLAVNTGRPGAIASIAPGGVVCWRHDPPDTSIALNEWRQAELQARKFSTPAYPIVVVPKYFRFGVSRIGVDRLWSPPS